MRKILEAKIRKRMSEVSADLFTAQSYLGSSFDD